MYGFNGYRQGNRPGLTSFTRPDGSMLQLGLGGLADKIRGSIDARNRAVSPAQGAAAGLAANQAAMGASPTAQGQAAGAAAAQAATNASAGAQPLRSFARGQAMAPRPMMPGAQGPDYGLGAPLTTPSAPTPAPRPAAPPAAGPAPGQAPMVDPGAMVATLNTPDISPKTHMAHEVGGQSVLLRNGADPRNPGPGDLLTYHNGQWVPGDSSLGNDLYEQLHITPE